MSKSTLSVLYPTTYCAVRHLCLTASLHLIFSFVTSFFSVILQLFSAYRRIPLSDKLTEVIRIVVQQ